MTIGVYHRQWAQDPGKGSQPSRLRLRADEGGAGQPSDLELSGL